MALVPADFFEQIQLTVLENYWLVLFATVSAAITELNQLMERSDNHQSYREGWEEHHLSFLWLSVGSTQPSHVIPLKEQLFQMPP